MSLLIDIRDPSWMHEEELRDLLAPMLPGVTIHCSLGPDTLPDVSMLAAVKLFPGVTEKLPNLKLVQKLGAGVETMVGNPELPPHVRVTRLKPQAAAQEIAEYCLAFVLREQRNMLIHAADTSSGRWNPIAPRQNEKSTVAILGLGYIGAITAKLFAGLGFRVLGWSRSPKSIENVDCFAGIEALPEVLSQSDYVASILPSTPDTRDLLDKSMFSKFKSGAMLINAGRGDLIVDEALVSALRSGHLGSAVLDVFREEPLPPDHPFWSCENLTITPHVSGWHQGNALEDVAQNYIRLSQNQPLLHEVDMQVGY